MKDNIIRILQRILGYNRYLWIFTTYKLRTIKNSKDEETFFYFLDLLNKDMVVLDIGANLGLMSYYLSKACKEVFAFEPMPNNLSNLYKLKENKQLTNLSILPYALGNKTGEITMVLPEINGAKKQGLSHVVSDKINEFNEGKQLKAQCYKLDDLERIRKQKISAIKIDVENFEYEVFRGAKEMIMEQRPIIYCELWHNQNRKDCFSLMTEMQYDIKYYDGKDLQTWNADKSSVLNYFFVPKES